ncbi:hypothetical protein EMIHUDRAFT_232075 [Emiliania huxleyi CCMP1516]|uniref:Uncharacterized protein n=2 Tax=Emiliania huxleyi TaxID=2903 RepID=A0A0D3K6B9_EMIH1|nr:hypothetical protein EMIHUDRAFT_232075 [Emiliania huxleyi CCMP1516]EOD31304.1 hypothetical protein EMIHUDRAFT_232075 [Emiliania huxleyi CCMP1516]|eukprot:XP_005783733.1 hypothetical protein EMIHUDRAFT_232075 [Emiliania huxleyi CCMP1516]
MAPSGVPFPRKFLTVLLLLHPLASAALPTAPPPAHPFLPPPSNDLAPPAGACLQQLSAASGVATASAALKLASCRPPGRPPGAALPGAPATTANPEDQPQPALAAASGTMRRAPADPRGHDGGEPGDGPGKPSEKAWAKAKPQ